MVGESPFYKRAGTKPKSLQESLQGREYVEEVSKAGLEVVCEPSGEVGWGADDGPTGLLGTKMMQMVW